MAWNESNYDTLQFGVNGAPANGQFLTPGFGASDANEIQVPIPLQMQLTDLSVVHTVASGGGETITYTVNIGGVATLATVDIVDPAVAGAYTGGQIAFAAGTLVSVEVTAGAGVGACVDVTATLRFMILE